MPIISDKREITNLKENQKTCLICDESGGRSERCAVITCDICCYWVCKECAGIDPQLYDFLTKTNTSINFICPKCKNHLPKIKDLLNIEQKQAEMECNMNLMQTKIEENRQSINKLEGLNISERLSKVEQVIQANKMEDVEFPPLLTFSDVTKKMQQEITSTQATTEKINTDLEEEKRRESRKLNLIVYGIPETQTDNSNQMKSDFLSLQELYENKIALTPSDFSNITRLGKKKDDQIRPIRISFYDAQIRKEVLINNKGLRYEGNEFNECNCKTNPGRHIHINVTTDKTRQEREEESKLREALNVRRQNGENVIIKRGKIIKTDQQESQARWAVISQDV